MKLWELIKKVMLRVRGSTGVRKLWKLKKSSILKLGGKDRLSGRKVNGSGGTTKDGPGRRADEVATAKGSIGRE